MSTKRLRGLLSLLLVLGLLMADRASVDDIGSGGVLRW